MRLAGRLKLGYYPLPPAEGEKIRNLLQFSPDPASVIDPCVGTGAALLQITKGGNCRLYGIELDSARAATAAAAGIATIQGSAFDTHSKVERFSLLYLNPPYDSEIGTLSNRRMEELFLEHTFRWLCIGGVLVFVIPFERLGTCIDVLAANFADVRPYLLSDSESQRFGQIVIFATRKRVTGSTIRSSRQALINYSKGEGEAEGGVENEEIARTIAGHAQVHFPGSTEDAAETIQDVLDSRDSLVRSLANDRTAYYNDGVIVIKNPKVPYAGTAFEGDLNDFLKLR